MAHAKLYTKADPSSFDWSFLSDPQAIKALRDAATSVAKQYNLNADELYSEAVVYCAPRPHKVNAYIAEGSYGYLYRSVRQQLGHHAKVETRRMNRHVPLSEPQLIEVQA